MVLKNFDTYIPSIIQDGRLSCKILACAKVILQNFAYVLQDGA